MSAEILRDLARAKAVFQLRAIEAVIRDSDAVRSTETEGLGSIRTGKPGPKASPETHISISNPTETGE